MARCGNLSPTAGRLFCMLFVEGFTLYNFGFASGVVSERTALRNVSGEPSQWR